MPIDKTLQKIKVQIGELSETMQSFVDETIQPSVADCEKLRVQMNDLLEFLAVYKHHKSNNELEPGFRIHAKVSEKSVHIDEAKETIYAETAHTEQQIPTKEKQPTFNTEDSKAKQPLLIGINDKFRFINELFTQNNAEYNIALEQLNNLNTWSDTEIYLNSLKSVYGWKDSSEVVKYFYALVRKRFD